MRSLRQHAETELRDDAVLARERHDVGKRANRRDFHKRRHPVRVTRAAAQGLHEFQRDADPRQVLVRIAAVVPLRIDDREGARQLGIGLVMVRDDQVHPQVACPRGGFRRANAAIHRDDQPRTVLVQPIDRRPLQTVAVAEPLRDEVHHVGAKQFERATQNHRRRHAVHVVVAVDGDAVFRFNCAEDALYGRAHVGQPERVVEILEARRQKAPRVIKGAKSTDTEQPRGDRRHTELPRERLDGTLVTRDRFPDSISLH